MERRPSKGKQRIEIKRIEDDEARQVTFSKRRNGLFKKGAEIVTLCGADVLLLIFSPSGRPYTFAQPDAESVINRFMLHQAPPSVPDPLYRHRDGVMEQLNRECMELAKQIDIEKAKRVALEGRVGVDGRNWQCLCDSGFVDLGLTELEHLWGGLAALKTRADARIGEIVRGGGASSSRLPLAVNPVSMVNPDEPFPYWRR